MPRIRSRAAARRSARSNGGAAWSSRAAAASLPSYRSLPFPTVPYRFLPFAAPRDRDAPALPCPAPTRPPTHMAVVGCGSRRVHAPCGEHKGLFTHLCRPWCPASRPAKGSRRSGPRQRTPLSLLSLPQPPLPTARCLVRCAAATRSCNTAAPVCSAPWSLAERRRADGLCRRAASRATGRRALPPNFCRVQWGRGTRSAIPGRAAVLWRYVHAPMMRLTDGRVCVRVRIHVHVSEADARPMPLLASVASTDASKLECAGPLNLVRSALGVPPRTPVIACAVPAHSLAQNSCAALIAAG